MVIFDNDTNYSLQIEGDGRFSCFAPSATQAFSAQTMTTARWYHLACTWTGTFVAVFVDGVQEGSAIGVGAAIDPGGAIGLGVEAPFPLNQLIGRLDSMRIWDVALDANEICRVMH
jgi:hypothetical protein